MKNPSCPRCSSVKDVIPIAYGYPGEELWEDEQSRKVRLGGCMIMDDSPEWYCKAAATSGTRIIRRTAGSFAWNAVK